MRDKGNIGKERIKAAKAKRLRKAALREKRRQHK
jgi:hypothetical protein